MNTALPKQLSHLDYPNHVRTDSINSLLISCYSCLWITIIFLAMSNAFLHWFIIPVLLCGIIVGIDVVDWLRSRLDIFDPAGILGLLGFHFFFIAPLLHVLWDHWTLFQVIPPPDWREWLGGMAYLNLLGLLVYRFTRSIGVHKISESRYENRWRLDRRRFFILVGSALFATALLQIWVYASFGGIVTYIETTTEPGETLEGKGFLFMFSESFPILALMAFAVYAGKKKVYKSWIVLGAVLLIYFVLLMLFGGLRGSRSNTVWALFWAVGIIHFWLRPISKKLVVTGCLFLITFMYFYGFFKYAGLEGLQVLWSAEARIQLEEQSDRNLRSTLLGDFGRSDVQAFLLYRLSRPDNDYEYAWGRTYFAAVSTLLPRSIVNRPPSKIKEGTEAQYGRGSYVPGLWQSSKVYGLAGETMLNFGPIVLPFAFMILGFMVREIRRLMMTIQAEDGRSLLLPLLVNLCFVVLVSDLDNDIFFLLKNGVVPFCVLILSSIRFVAIRRETLEVVTS